MCKQMLTIDTSPADYPGVAMSVNARHAVVFLVAISFGLSALSVPAETRLGIASLSLASGVAGFSLMAGAALLASRWRWLEAVFGGLDRVYQVHKWLGIWALVMASVHLAFKAGLSSWDVAPILSLPGDVTRLVRQLSFVALMLIVLLALNRKIPFSTWRWWHKLSGPFLLIVIAHWLSIKSPILLHSPAGWWLAGMATLGVLGAGWKLLLYPWLSSHADYRIVGVTPGQSAVRIELLPTGRAIAFRPGQFGFLVLQVEGLREPHPFTLAGAPDAEGRVVFMIRALGDHTRRLVAEAVPGMLAAVYAPFGKFERRANSTCEIWIAGGVGISPFLAWLDDAQASGLERVNLFYFHTPGRSFPAPHELAELTAARGVALTCIDSGPDSPAFADALTTIVRNAGAENVDIDFCGPAGLLHATRALLQAHGVPASRIRSELFEFR
ncbi:MAG TPA: ferredoxin reductase family protein [Dokdonella sp.]|nr:ferredoxin reductase family protein [Dokdonella sp.]